VATTDQTVSGVPGRYANALFQLATEENSVDKTGNELATFQAAIEASPELKRLVGSPVYSADEQIAAIGGLCDKAGIGGTTLNFLKLLAKNRRLSAISAIIATYATLLATAKGEVQAEVASAEKLSDKHIKDIKAALKASIGREVQLATRVDPSILGGLVVKVGSRMLDNSLKTKLSNLKIAMKGTA
jgi:F-type H+-transporting ATPase subunit delta